MKRKNKIFSILLCAIMFTLAVLGGVSVSAASPVGGSDGTYSVPVNLDGLTMGKDNFSSTATVEKSGDRYYMSFGHSSSISNLRLNLGGGKVGYTAKIENGWTIYTYTLGTSNLQGDLPFTAYINAMAKDVSFTISLNLANASKKSDSIADLGERPGEFVPVIVTNAGNEYELIKGSVFAIPEATAKLGNEDCEVSISVYYLNNGVQEEVTVTNNNRFTLENAGEYHLVYKASSNAYTTSLGNPTCTVLDVKIISSLTASEIAKFADENGVVPEGANLMASRVTAGTVFDTAKEKMATLSENYEVFTVKMINADGSEVSLSGAINLYLQAKSTFDRTQVVVYHMAEDGTLTEIDCNGYGRYVEFDTDQTGTFIVCIPGIAFVMPMWGYALICVGAVALIAGGMTAIVIVRKRKKKNQK